MTLIVTEHGDESVGIFRQTYLVEAPLPYDMTMSNIDDLNFFRDAIVSAYNEFAIGGVTALYDFEIEADNKAWVELNSELKNTDKP